LQAIVFKTKLQILLISFRKNINLCSLIIPKDRKWKYINLNPSPPTLKGLLKVHKPDTPIRPIINWKNAPAYKLTKLISEIFEKEILWPYAFNINNSIQLMTDLQKIPYNHNISFGSFDITNMYSNVPTSKLPQTINLVSDQIHTTKKFKREVINLTRTLLKQNYFQFQDHIYKHKEGLGIGAPTSSIFSEVYLQYIQHTELYDILIHNKMLGYIRYVDDILTVNYTDTTDIDDVSTASILSHLPCNLPSKKNATTVSTS
jgi:hypothetical protein